MTTQLLLVEPDQETRDQLRALLQKNGFAISVLYRADSLEKRLALEVPSVIVLRHDVPGEDGLSALRKLRERGYDMPVLIVSESNDVIDKILAFELGANDYLVDPHDPRELLARVRNALRSYSTLMRSERRPLLERIAFDDCELDLPARRLYRDGVEIPLRSSEFATLAVLASHPMRPLSRSRVVQMIGEVANVCERSLDVIVFRLRRALQTSPSGRQYIQTLRGEGYVFCPDDALIKSATTTHNRRGNHETKWNPGDLAASAQQA